MTRALVTGATGFVGGHVLHALARDSSSTRAFARPTSNIGPLDKVADVFRGDLRDPETLNRAVRGVDVVFHCAGEVSDWGDRARFRETNVMGLRNLVVRAARTTFRAWL